MIKISIMRTVASDEVLIATVKPETSSNQQKAVMGENVLNLLFTLGTFIDFKIGDYCDVYSERYYLFGITPPALKKESRFHYEYTLKMYADYFKLDGTQYMSYDNNNELKDGQFSLMGNPNSFMDLVVQNANRISSGWVKGEVIDADYQNMSFNGESVLAVLGRLAQQFQTEYRVEGKTIHLAQRARETGITFRQGKDKGLYDIARTNQSNASLVTRLYAFGGSQNLPADYRDYAGRLLMPSGKISLEKNVDNFGVIEATQVFENIFPHRTGTVTGVDATNVFQFSDSSMDFDVNAYLLPGVAAKVTFNTGQLAGYTFDIQKYDATGKTFTILKNKDEKSIDVPNALLRASLGDQYVLVDITLPQTYVDAAEEALESKAQAYLEQCCIPQYSYSVTTDPVFLSKRNIKITDGDLVWILDQDVAISRQIRVTQITREFENEFSYQLTLSDQISNGPLTELYNGQSDNSRAISALNDQINNRASESNFVGDVTIDQGSLIIQDISTAPLGITLTPLSIGSDGKLYKS